MYCDRSLLVPFPSKGSGMRSVVRVDVTIVSYDVMRACILRSVLLVDDLDSYRRRECEVDGDGETMTRIAGRPSAAVGYFHRMDQLQTPLHRFRLTYEA